MGNSLPFTPPPTASPSRAVIFMELQCIRSYLQQPWRHRHPGKLQVIGSAVEVPPALSGVVPVDEYRRMMSCVEDQAAKYRGGRIQLCAALFLVCVIIVILLRLVISHYADDVTFFNPITLGVLGALELGVLTQSGRFFQREEKLLKKKLLELFHPWRQEYRVVAKLRKSRGHIGGDRNVGIRDGKKSTTYYCLLLDRMGPNDDMDTVSLSSDLTDLESEIDSEV